MVFLNNLGEQLKNFWEQSSKSGRIGFVAIGLFCVAAIVGVGIWSSRPHYVPVASNLGPAEAAEIVSTLDADGILNQLNFSGSAVLVPKTQWNRARLLLGDLVGPMPLGADDFDDSLLSDPSLNHFRMLRHQEETLARTIARLNSVVNATVHIGQPQPSPFVQERTATTASVILELRPGVIFTREHAAAVVSMVANSVSGLDPQAVSVVDTKGRMLSSHTSSADTEVTNRLEYQRKLESDLASKAEVMLRELLGTGRAVVRVTADLDFTQIKREEITYDPEFKVKKTERIKTMSRTGIAKAALGVAGTASNVGNATSTRQKAPFTETEEENEVEYENAMVRDTVTEAPGAIKRLTIAAVVDLSTPDDQQAESAAAPIKKEQIEAIIKQAVGFDIERNDAIEVLVSKLVGSGPIDDSALIQTQQWQHYNDLLRNGSLGLASIVALVLGLLIVRKMRPVMVPRTEENTLTPERVRLIGELSAQAQANPEAVSKIISAWLQEPEETATEQTKAAA